MKPISSWNFTPYTPLDRPERAQNPYICRIAPGLTTLDFDFIDNGAPSKATHTLYYRIRSPRPTTDHTAVQQTNAEPEWMKCEMEQADRGQLCSLKPHTDYEFFVERDCDGARSETRLVYTSVVPGRVVNYLHPEDPAYAFSGQYLCSPCLCRLPSGRLLSSMDVFRGGAPQNLTILFYSDDNGDSWHYLTELFPCFWGQLFVRGNRLYMLAVSSEYGDLLIGASDNEGRDWTLPTVLFRGAASPHERGLHRAPMRLWEANGRIWTDVEYGAWEKHEMNNAVLSAPDDAADYTDPAVWSMTEFWRYADFAAKAEPEQLVSGCVGGIEGTVISAPDGTLYDFLRYAQKKCLLLKINSTPMQPEGVLSYAGLVTLDITPSKFDIVWDDVSEQYYMLASHALEEPKTNRNLLALFRSADLITWEFVADILDAKALNPAVVGFQYVSFLIEGDDILFLSRTAYGKPANFHDSNYQTFHRIQNFRNLTCVR